MYNIKMSLTIELQGGQLLSKQECLKKLRKPVLSKRTGKQLFKNGKPVFKTELVDDFDKCDKHTLKVYDKVKKENQFIHFYTRKSIPARQHIDMSYEAYEYMTSTSFPEGYQAPHDFMPNKTLLKKGIGRTQQAWMSLSEDEKLMWHFNRIAADKRGKVVDYIVYDD